MIKILFKCLVLISSVSLQQFRDLNAQSFTKLTTGAIVNDIATSRGSAWADYDNDGDVDLFRANSNGENNVLYRNNGDGTFTKINNIIIVQDDGTSLGCSWGDYDNDGNLDLFVANANNESNVLYRNNGNGTFTKVSTGAIVNDGGDSKGCAWGDYDNDGNLDLFVANKDQNSFLYHNNGNGTFTKITDGDIVSNVGDSEGCSWGDFDNDGDLDLFVANISDQNNFLYQNNGNGTFKKITAGPIVTDGGQSRGGSWGDYDNDGDLDLYVTNKNQRNFLYRNDGPPNYTFTKITSDVIVAEIAQSQGSIWDDFDNDGDLDLFVANDANQNDFLFRNNGDATFTKITSGAVVQDTTQGGISSVSGDYDNDGDLDLFVANSARKNSLFSNNGNSNSWINIRCVGTISNTSAIGAKVGVKATINGKPFWQIRDVSGQTGYLSQNSLNAEFGLGNATIIDSVKIEWPSRITQFLTNEGVNQFLTVMEPQFPTAKTEGATDVTATSAMLNGTVNPNGLSTTVIFEFGTTTSYGSEITATPSPVSGTNAVSVSAVLSGLSPNSTYHYRIVATNSAGTTNGLDQTVTTFIFTEIANSAGIVDTGPGDGRGVAFGDVDNDGDLDIYVSNETPQNSLFINNGQGQFDEKAAMFGVASAEEDGQGVAFGDIDNDGDLDLFVASFGSSNKLFRNNGDNTFTNIAVSARVNDPGTYARGVAFADIDNDGYLDLYVVNQKTDFDPNPQPNRLYHNNRDNTFTDIALEAGVTGTEDSVDQAAAFADIDNDGDLDLYVAGGGPDLLFRNNGELPFTEIGGIANLADGGNGIGIAFGDIDNDGDLDLYLSRAGDPSQSNLLFRNDGTGIFQEIGSETAIADTGFGAGVAFADIDNDGDLDLFLVNTAGEQDRLFLNDGDGIFSKVDTTAGIADAESGRGAAFGDIDNDGDLDLYVAVSAAADRLYRNEVGNSNNYLVVKTVGTISNRDGIGARIRVVTGALSQIREVDGGSGYLSQNSLPVEFGLGQATQVDSVIVRWPSGIKQILTNVPVDQFFTIIESANTLPAAPQNLQASTGDRQVTLTWNANAESDILRYRIYGDTSSNPTAKVDSVEGVNSNTRTILGLTNGTTYYFRIKAVDSALQESVFSDEVSAVPSTTPTVSSDSPSNIAQTSATLNGTVNPNGLSTTVQFEYGTTVSYGNQIPASQSPLIGSSGVAVSTVISGLSPNTTYHFRVVATNSAGTTFGSDQTFTTTSAGTAPSVNTNTATNVSSTSATLNGTVNPNGLSTTVQFEYGTTVSYGNQIPASQSPVTGSSAVPVSAAISGLSTNTSYHFRVVGTNSAGTTLGSDQTFITSADQTTPSLSHTAVSAASSGQAITISATLSDNVGVQSATLFYRLGGAASFTSSAMTNTSGSTWQGTIPASFITGRGAEYYLSAADAAGNTTTFPTSNPQTNPQVIQVISSGGLAFSSPTKAYRMISVPIDLDNSSPSSVLDELGVYDDTQWRLLRYLNGVNREFTKESIGNFDPGVGFWLITKDFKSINTGAGNSITTANNFIITLQPGWNQIGNPFAFPVNWSEVIKLGNVQNVLVGYQGTLNEATGYDFTRTRLEPFQGYFVNNQGSTTTTIEISAKSATGTIAEKESAILQQLIEVQGEEWSLQITAQSDRFLDKDNYLGVLSDAADAWDRHDFSEAPFFDSFVSLYFPHPDWEFPDLYTGDFRTISDDGHYWDFQVKTNLSLSNVVLTLANPQNLPPNWEAKLLDKASQVAVNLLADKQYTYLSGEGETVRDFRMVVGKSDFVENNDLNLAGIPEDFVLSQNYPNPFNPETRLNYELPATTEILIAVFNLKGQLIRVLLDERQGAGRFTVSWDGKLLSGVPVASGMYLVRMQAGRFTTARKIVLSR